MQGLIDKRILQFALYADLVSALVLMAFMPLVPRSLLIFTNLVEWKVGRIAWEAYRELSAYFAESLQGLTTLKLFHQMDADKILVMRDGRLVEQGRHKELLALQGEYAKLVAAQRNGPDERVAL